MDVRQLLVRMVVSDARRVNEHVDAVRIYRDAVLVTKEESGTREF